MRPGPAPRDPLPATRFLASCTKERETAPHRRRPPTAGLRAPARIAPWALLLLLPACAELPPADALPPGDDDDSAFPDGDDDDADAGPPAWTALSTGGRHGCGVTTAEKALCWGAADHGESSPPEGTALATVSAGARHTCGITSAGEVLCWGFDGSGQASPPQGTFSSVSAGWAHTCGIRTDGAAVCWGLDSHGQASPPEGAAFTALSAATYHSCGVTTTGEVLCWGWDRYGQATPPAGRVFNSVGAGRLFSCGSTVEGEVLCWGADADGQTTPPGGVALSSVVAGDYHGCGLTEVGEALCWGQDGAGRTTPPEGTLFTSLAAGGGTSCGLTPDREALCWGRNDVGQALPPDPENPPPAPEPPDGVPTGSPASYCDGNDPARAECDPQRAYDPWIASTGEIPYWIREARTVVIPFLATYEPGVEYGFLQLTSPEPQREITEDIFHLWFSETPDGPVLDSPHCEWWARQARGYVYWTQRGDEGLGEVCDLGDVPRLLYLNFETRCYPDRYQGLCDDENRRKSDRTYQFDVARRVSWE